MVVALFINSLDDATEVPSVHLSHERGHVAVLEVLAEQPGLEFVLVDDLPGPTVGKPNDDALGVRVGEHLVELHGEGRLPLGVGPTGSGVGIDIGGSDPRIVVVEILLDGVDHCYIGVGGGRSSRDTRGGAIGRRLGSCRGGHSGGIEAGIGTCAACRRHEGGQVVEIDVAWKTHFACGLCCLSTITKRLYYRLRLTDLERVRAT